MCCAVSSNETRRYILLVKSVTRITALSCFHKTIPPRTLNDGLKPFRILLPIRRENRFENRQNLI
jgi:hypothetical protein